MSSEDFGKFEASNALGLIVIMLTPFCYRSSRRSRLQDWHLTVYPNVNFSISICSRLTSSDVCNQQSLLYWRQGVCGRAPGRKCTKAKQTGKAARKKDSLALRSAITYMQ